MAPGSASWAQRNALATNSGPSASKKSDSRQLAVVAEDLVGDVPLGDAPAVVADDGLDVELELLVELVAAPALLRDPARELLVPDERVPANRLAVFLREVHQRVGVGEVELPALGLEVLHLHDVLGREAVEVLRERVLVLGVGPPARAAPFDRGPERHLALRGGERVGQRRARSLLDLLRRRRAPEMDEADAHAAAAALACERNLELVAPGLADDDGVAERAQLLGTQRLLGDLLAVQREGGAGRARAPRGAGLQREDRRAGGGVHHDRARLGSAHDDGRPGLSRQRQHCRNCGNHRDSSRHPADRVRIPPRCGHTASPRQRRPATQFREPRSSTRRPPH